MLITSIYMWWFTAGWGHLARFLFEKMGDALSFFSFSSLLRTLFAPYRQISTVSANATRASAFLDRLVSRLVGFTTRLFLMLAGLMVFITEFIVFAVIIISWPFIPFLPIIGVVLTILGVLPR